MKDTTIVEGRCFYARSEPEQAGVWAVFSTDGSYVESLIGSIYAARERVNALDFDVLIRKGGHRQRIKGREDRASQAPDASHALVGRKKRTA